MDSKTYINTFNAYYRLLITRPGHSLVVERVYRSSPTATQHSAQHSCSSCVLFICGAVHQIIACLQAQHLGADPRIEPGLAGVCFAAACCSLSNSPISHRSDYSAAERTTITPPPHTCRSVRASGAQQHRHVVHYSSARVRTASRAAHCLALHLAQECIF